MILEINFIQFDNDLISDNTNTKAMLPSSGQQFYCLYSTGTESSPCKGPADSKSIIFQNSFIFIMRDASIVKVPPAIAICENIIIFYFKVN